MKQPELAATLEAILFVATGPLSVAELVSASEAAEEDVLAALDLLGQQLRSGGLRLSVSEGAYELTTDPALASLIERFLGMQAKTELSRPALETLAIVVYRQPVTKFQVEEIRGIASDQTLRNLLQRDLIIEAGTSPEPGRPILYRPSHRLLHHLGIQNFDDLPSLESLSSEDHAN